MRLESERKGAAGGELAAPFVAAARRYSELGWAIVRAHGKRPVDGGWQTAKPLEPEYAAGQWSRWGERFNLGVVLGPSSLAVVEFDSDAAGETLLALIDHELPLTPTVQSGSGRLHFYFADRGIQHRTRGGLELRTGRHFMALPPSVHPNGTPYKWLLEPELALAEVPPAVLAHFAEETTRRNGTAPIAEVIRDGERNSTLTSLAGSMRRRGASEAAILAALKATPCETPLPDDELVSIARSVGRYKPAAAQPAPLQATPLDDVAMRSIEWLEKPLWQRSAFELLAGPKGAGKGTYLAGLAARISRSSSVLFISTEDSTAIDLKPRLVAAGAEIARCFVIAQHVRLPDDVEALRELGSDLGVGLLVIDPVANHIGSTNSNSDAEVRDAIAPLNKLADELGCLVIGVRHPGKDRARGALASILGSTAWVDTPRAVVMIAVDDQDPAARVIQVVAGNRSPNGSAQAFRIDAVEVPGLAEPITLAVELGESSKSVDDLLAVKLGSKSAKARELILNILEDEGEQESDALDARVARETGISAKTARNVRSELANEGLVKPHPDKDEFGEIVRWKVSRSAAPRP